MNLLGQDSERDIETTALVSWSNVPRVSWRPLPASISVNAEAIKRKVLEKNLAVAETSAGIMRALRSTH